MGFLRLLIFLICSCGIAEGHLLYHQAPKRLRVPASDTPSSEFVGRAEKTYRDLCRSFHMGLNPQTLAKMRERDRQSTVERTNHRTQLERERIENAQSDARSQSEAATRQAAFRAQQLQFEQASEAQRRAGIRDSNAEIRQLQSRVEQASVGVNRLVSGQGEVHREFAALKINTLAWEAELRRSALKSRGVFAMLPAALKVEILLKSGLTVAAEVANSAFNQAFDTWANTVSNVPLELGGPHGRLVRGIIRENHHVDNVSELQGTAEWFAERASRDASRYPLIPDTWLQKIAGAKSPAALSAALTAVLAKIKSREAISIQGLETFEKQATRLAAGEDRVRALSYSSSRGRELLAKLQQDLDGAPSRLAVAREDLAYARTNLRTAQEELIHY